MSIFKNKTATAEKREGRRIFIAESAKEPNGGNVKKTQPEEEGVWRTVRGRRIFIREGESVREAIDRSLGNEFSSAATLKPLPSTSYTTLGKDALRAIEKSHPNFMRKLKYAESYDDLSDAPPKARELFSGQDELDRYIEISDAIYEFKSGIPDAQKKLRKGKRISAEDEKVVTLLEGLMVPTKKQTVIYRGQSEKEDWITRVLKSKTLTDYGMASTSAKRAIATDFAVGYDETKANVLYSIVLPKGTPHLPIDAVSASKRFTESEVVLPRKAQFKVSGYALKRGIHHVQLTYVGKARKPRPKTKALDPTSEGWELYVEDGDVDIRNGQKYNPDWYLQPRDGGKWSTIALTRKDKGHLDDYGDGTTQFNMNVSNTDKKMIAKAFGMSAENLASMFHEALAPAIPDASKVTMTANYFPSMQDNAMVTVARFESADGEMCSVTRVYDYLDGTASQIQISYLKLPEGEQGAGVGKNILAKYLDLSDHIGAERLGLSANIDMGAYAWARYGFVPTPESWKSLCATIRKNLVNIDFGDNKDATALSGHIKTLTAPGTDPRNVRAIAALRPVVKRHGIGMEDAKLGLALLRETHWDGVAHVGDKETMAHLKATAAKDESFNTEDWDNLVAPTKPLNLKSINEERGVLFCQTKTGKQDAMFHKNLLPAGSLVADQVAIRQLMSIGMSRAEARRYISVGRGYGG